MAASEAGFPRHPVVRLTILFGLRDHFHHQSLMVELIQRARRAKLSGATAFEGVEGFGNSGRLHRTHLLSEDTPVALVIVDQPERIQSFLTETGELLAGLLVTLDDVDVVGV
jgi:PII-like signaling protein